MSQFSWLLTMAWRDSRRQRSRLLLFVSSIVIGIASLVAIQSFSENLRADISGESKTLLGADLVVEGNQPAPAAILAAFDSVEGEKSKAVNFVSMVYFPAAGGTRLAQITALEGDFPFYGTISTLPVEAYRSFRKGPRALVDHTMMLQFGLRNGDSVKVGAVTFAIEGEVMSAPGRAGIASAMAPVVYIPMDLLDATGLVQRGSRVTHQYYFKTAEADKWLARLKPRLEGNTLSIETVASRQQSLGQAFDNMTDFLNLVAFIALLLGCIGVASGVHIYIKGKMGTVAVLRCLGMSGRQAFGIYLIQVAVMGLVGSLAGALLGSILQKALPWVLADFLPIQHISTAVSGKAVAQGILTGMLVAVSFALLPLLSVRKVSPLLTLRASYEEAAGEGGFDPLRWVVYLLLVLLIGGFAWLQAGSLTNAAAFVAGVLAAFGLLALLAGVLMQLLRRFFPIEWSYIWRQSIANLFRPNNQTLILTVVIGLGSLLISLLFSVQQLLLKQVQLSGSGQQPNTILFDIQSSQKDGVAKLVQSKGLPLIQQVPIVTMRLDHIDGRTKKEHEADSLHRIPEWIFDREYRCTYRDTLIDTEKLIAGEWHAGKPKDGTIYVSLAERVATAMHAKVGTRLTFNVQGVPVETVVNSIRQVNFNRVQTNFFVVFPSGVLEQAPQFHVVVTRTESPQQSAVFQRELVQAFPNVSFIDLTQILKTADEVLGKISFVVRFMASFSILTGFLVLISAVILSRQQRVRESILLRTIGASRRQVLWINALEYLLLGLLAALAGSVLSIAGVWALCRFVFSIPFEVNWLSAILTISAIAVTTVAIGLLNTRSVVNKPPLEVLRVEG